MTELQTIFSSNTPIDCHILKGRLDSDGVDCFILDENFVWTFPFRAVAIGGVKLKVSSDQIELADKIIRLVKQDKLVDEDGEYEMEAVFENEIYRQDEILSLKSRIRKDPSLFEKLGNLSAKYLNQDEINQFIESEKEFQKISNTKLNFTWEQFWCELFDFDQSIFRYLRTRPVEYYLEKELVDNFNSQPPDKSEILCPKCESDNVIYGQAIDYRWNILYILLGLLIYSCPFPLVRSKYHCFECGNDFKYRKSPEFKKV